MKACRIPCQRAFATAIAALTMSFFAPASTAFADIVVDKQPPPVVQTEDSSMMAVAGALAAIGGLGVILLARRRRSVDASGETRRHAAPAARAGVPQRR